MEKTEMVVVRVELSRRYQNKVWDETTTRAGKMMLETPRLVALSRDLHCQIMISL